MSTHLMDEFISKKTQMFLALCLLSQALGNKAVMMHLEETIPPTRASYSIPPLPMLQRVINFLNDFIGDSHLKSIGISGRNYC